MEWNSTRRGQQVWILPILLLHFCFKKRETQRILNSFWNMTRNAGNLSKHVGIYWAEYCAKLHLSLIAYFGWSLFDKCFWKHKSCINQHFSTISECRMAVCNVKSPLVVTNPNRIIIQQPLPLRCAEMLILFFQLGGEFEHLFGFTATSLF